MWTTAAACALILLFFVVCGSSAIWRNKRLIQAVVRGTTNPAPCCYLANDTDLWTPVVWAMAGDNKQIDLWPADPFTRIDPKFNQVVPWSRHMSLPWKFHANRSSLFLVMLLTKKQRKKSPENNIPVTKLKQNNCFSLISVLFHMCGLL